MEKLYFKGMNPTSDLVILRKDQNDQFEVLMIQRNGENKVEHMKWALPGGFINTEAKQNEPFLWGLETPKQAALREALEEIMLRGIELEDLSDIGIYDQINRDPRNENDRWVGSYVYGVLLKDNQGIHVEKGDEISEYQWKKCKDLRNDNIAFDHEMIIADAISVLSQVKSPQWNKRPKI